MDLNELKVEAFDLQVEIGKEKAALEAKAERLRAKFNEIELLEKEK